MNCQFVDLAKRNFIFRYSALFIALVCLLTLIACGGRGESSEEEPAIPTITVPSQTGPREIPVSGSLTFPNTASLTFESPGIVGEILVSEGDEVQTGQTLASLDAHSVSQLEVAVALAQLRVTTAENGLESLSLDPALMIASAELEVARAEVGLDEAQKALDDLRQRPGINSEAAQLAVVQAEIALDDAHERLDDLLKPKRLAVSGLEARIAAAKVELDAAQEAYDDIKDGSFPDEVLRDARNGVAFATTAHEVAVRTGADARTAAQNALVQAQDGEYLAREQYTGLYEFWFGAELTDAELQMTPQEVIAEWGIDLDATFHRFNPDYVDIEPTPDDPDTRWFEPKIWAWLNLHLQFWGIVPTCADERVLAKTERCITRELETAYDALDAARDALAAARHNVDTTAERTEDAVAAAEAALSDARDALEEVEDGPDASLVESAEKRLQLANATLQEAEEDLAELTVDIDPLNVALARAAVAHAEVAFEEANDALELSMDDDLYIAQAGRALELASAALINAETTLDNSQALLSEQISAAEAELAHAQASLDEAQEALDGAVVRSSINGIVSIINIEPDDPVNDELTAIEVVSTDVVEIDGTIDAAGRPFVHEGASAVVTIASVGDTSMGGSVNFISEEARTERGVVSYAVRIRVDVPPGVNVPISLSAASAVITGSDSATLYEESYRRGGERAPSVAARPLPALSSYAVAH